MESDVHKLQKEIAMTRRTVKQKYQLASPSPSKQVTEKRLLRSPSTNLPAQKLQKTFPTTVSVINITSLLTFESLCEKSARKPESLATATTPQEEKKPVRRSLGFNETKRTDESTLTGEVEVIYIHVHGCICCLIASLCSFV